MATTRQESNGDSCGRQWRLSLIIVPSGVALLDIVPAVALHIVWDRMGQANFFVYPVDWSLSAGTVGIPDHTADRVGKAADRADMFAGVVHSPSVCSCQKAVTMKPLV